MVVGVTFTADYIAYHAAVRPDHPVMIDSGRSVTYRQFHDDLRRVVAVLAELRLNRDGYVAVESASQYRHWLLLQGLECLGITSFSFAAESGEEIYGSLITQAALVLHDGPAVDRYQRHLFTDEVWWQSVLARSPLSDLPPNPGPDRALRLVCSSGTTARAKAMVLTAAQIDFRLGGYLWGYDLSPRSRHLIETGFSRQAEYLRSIATLRAGGTVIHDGGALNWTMLQRARPTHINIMPVRLSALMAQPAPEPWPDRLHFSTYGGTVSAALRRSVMASIASAVVEHYGTNETGAVATLRDDGAALLFPGVTLEIVDDQDRILPIGASGRIRIRSAGCVTGYLAAPDLESANFRHGWFYPGDLGRLDAPGVLRLQGRQDDILNICGIKLHAPEYEQRFSTIAGLADVAVTDILDSRGMAMLCVVLVLQPDADISVIRARIVDQMTVTMGDIYLVAADAIPRTETGKIRRKPLREMAQKAASAYA